MSKRWYYGVILLLFIVAFVACSDDDAAVPDSGSSSVSGSSVSSQSTSVSGSSDSSQSASVSSSSSQSSQASSGGTYSTGTTLPTGGTVQTFDDVTGGATYAPGSSTANAKNITWSWNDGREDLLLNGKAYCAGKNTSTLTATLPDGVGAIGFKFKYGYDNRAVVVKINGVTVATSPVSTSSIQTFSVLVNSVGSTTVALETTGRVIIDDITWTDGTPPENDPPTVAITSPGASVNAFTLSMAGTAADSGTDASGVKEVWVKLDSGSYVKASGTTSWSYDFGSVTAGSHTVYAFSKDNAGNYSSTNSVSTTVTFPSDTTAPTVTIVSTGRTVSGSASDNYGVKEVKVSLDNSTWYTASGTTAWSYTFSSITAGDYTVYVKAVDFAGNETSPVVSSAFNVKLAKWTVMVYLCADNDLEGPGVEDFNEMELGLYDAVQAGNGEITNQVQVIVLMDRAVGESSADGNWTDTRLFKILPDNNMSVSASLRLDDGGSNPWSIPNLGEKKMDDPATLSWFMGYCKDKFPAQNYGLILWNHGGGTRSQRSATKPTRPLKEVCWDDASGSWEPLYLDEVQQAVDNNFNSSAKLGFIGFDACLMGMTEVAYEFRNLASYMVASMQSEQGDGWDYQYILNHLGTGDVAPVDFAKLLVEAYKVFIEANSSSSGETLAATDLSKMEDLKTSVDAFAVAMYNENKKTALEGLRDASVNYMDSDPAYSEYYPFYDLYDFANKVAVDSSNGFSTGLKNAAADVVTKMTAAIVRCYGENGNGQSYYYNSDAAAMRGLSIFFASSTTDYANQGWYTTDDNSSDSSMSTTIYGKIDFANYSTDTTVRTWRDLMDAWYKN